MRAVWSSPGNSTIQGVNNASFVRSNNKTAEALNTLEELQRKHQEEDVVDGGDAASIQFHYLISPTFTDNGASPTAPLYIFDANSGSAGTASWIFPNRRDFNNRREV